MDYIAIYRNQSTELAHYGIKGQVHGKRRFQNEDGTLTPAGRERYQKYGAKSAQASAELTAVGASVTKNQAARQINQRKAEARVALAKKGIGNSKMAEAKLLAVKGKNILGMAKDAMKLSMVAAKSAVSLAPAALMTAKLLKNSSNPEKTERDMAKSMAKGAGKHSLNKAVNKLLG